MKTKKLDSKSIKMASEKMTADKLAVSEAKKVLSPREKAAEERWLRAKRSSNEQNIIDAGRD